MGSNQDFANAGRIELSKCECESNRVGHCECESNQKTANCESNCELSLHAVLVGLLEDRIQSVSPLPASSDPARPRRHTRDGAAYYSIRAGGSRSLDCQIILRSERRPKTLRRPLEHPTLEIRWDNNAKKWHVWKKILSIFRLSVKTRAHMATKVIVIVIFFKKNSRASDLCERANAHQIIVNY